MEDYQQDDKRSTLVKDLTKGRETKVMLVFAIPLVIGNLFQQLYNVADTIVVGRFLGAGALAAVGSSYALMIFLTSIILGLAMGSGVAFSMYFGAKNTEALKRSIFTSFWFIAAVTLVINVLALLFIDQILHLTKIPADIWQETRDYLQIIFYGIGFISLYNFFAAVLRSMGNSMIPLIFLIIAAVMNVVLDIVFIVPLQMGVAGAALATVIAQAFSAIGIMIYALLKVPEIRPERRHLRFNKVIFREIVNYSVLASLQQSIMNFGILLVQGLINSFGVTVMAAFAAAVKIDSFAYMPVQDFGNAFATFIAQNKGANKPLRIRQGIRGAVKIITLACLVISVFVVFFAKPLMGIFISQTETEVIQIGVQYLRIEASFYILIGYLFMFYGLYRGFGETGMSIVLTLVSLGTRVVLSYFLSSFPAIGLVGIWWAIPIGWALANLLGYYKMKRTIFQHVQ